MNLKGQLQTRHRLSTSPIRGGSKVGMYPCSQPPCQRLLTALTGFRDSLPCLEADHSPDGRPSYLVAACQRKGLSRSHHSARQALQETGRAEDEPWSRCQGPGRSWRGGKRGCPSQQPHCPQPQKCQTSCVQLSQAPGLKWPLKLDTGSPVSLFWGRALCLRHACVSSPAPRGPEKQYITAATRLLNTQDDPTYHKVIQIQVAR